MTAAFYAVKQGGVVHRVRVDLPNCCFPDYRAAKSKVNVAEAARLYNRGGWTYLRLAAKYGVTGERIRQKLRGRIKPRVAVERTCRRCKNPFRIMPSSRAVLCGECRQFVANYKQCKCGRWCHKNAKACRECADFHQRKFDRGLASALYREGYGVPDIAAHLGATNRAIYAAFGREDVPRRPATRCANWHRVYGNYTVFRPTR